MRQLSEDESKIKYWLPNADNTKTYCEAEVNSVVVIGPNGSGKSKLGAWIEQQDFERSIESQHNAISIFPRESL